MKKILLFLSVGAITLLSACNDEVIQENKQENKFQFHQDSNIGITFEYPSDLVVQDNSFYKKEVWDCKRTNSCDGYASPAFAITTKEDISIDDFVLESINPNYIDLFKENLNKYTYEKIIGGDKFTILDNRNFDQGGCQYFLEGNMNYIMRISSTSACFENDIWQEFGSKLMEEMLMSIVITKKDEMEDTEAKTANWKPYSNFGVKIKYPDDGTYAVETPDSNSFTISQEHPGNRVHIRKTAASPLLQNHPSTKVISDKIYKVFYDEGMGNGYGYVTEKNGQFYSFESVWGTENEVFELIMTTVEFE